MGLKKVAVAVAVGLKLANRGNLGIKVSNSDAENVNFALKFDKNYYLKRQNSHNSANSGSGAPKLAPLLPPHCHTATATHFRHPTATLPLPLPPEAQNTIKSLVKKH
jgi:hypothetical protein